VPKNLLDLRFVVRRPDGFGSSIWRMWATRQSDIYLSTRGMASITKYSFHRSGISRQAFTSEHGIPSTMSDRVMKRWRRPGTPPEGSGDATGLFSLAVPTDFLSRTSIPKGKVVEVIPAAPAGGATYIELFLTRESKDAVDNAFAARGERHLFGYCALPTSEAVGLAWSHDAWENRDLLVPGNGTVADLLFAADDPLDTGRPVRITLGPDPRDGDAALVQELGGYPVPGTGPTGAT
jgi:hypothetical protein